MILFKLRFFYIHNYVWEHVLLFVISIERQLSPIVQKYDILIWFYYLVRVGCVRLFFNYELKSLEI